MFYFLIILWMLLAILIWRQYKLFDNQFNIFKKLGTISFSGHPLINMRIEEAFEIEVEPVTNYAVIASPTCPYCLDAFAYLKETVDMRNVLCLLGVNEYTENVNDDNHLLTYLQKHAPQTHLMKINDSVFSRWTITLYPLILELNNQGIIVNIVTLQTLRDHLKRSA